jgi:hypothetical protein
MEYIFDLSDSKRHCFTIIVVINKGVGEISFGGGGASQNICRPFFRTQTNLQNSRPKKF